MLASSGSVGSGLGGAGGLGTPGGGASKACRVFISCESKFSALGVALAAALGRLGHEAVFDPVAIARGSPGFDEVRRDTC